MKYDSQYLDQNKGISTMKDIFDKSKYYYPNKRDDDTPFNSIKFFWNNKNRIPKHVDLSPGYPNPVKSTLSVFLGVSKKIPKMQIDLQPPITLTTPSPLPPYRKEKHFVLWQIYSHYF